MSALTGTSNKQWSMAILEFLNRVGIPAIAVTGDEAVAKAFTPHVLIKNGTLEVDVDHVFPGNILHEAGHLAIVPAPFRHLASGTLGAVQKAMGAYFEANPGGMMVYPEDPICRAIMQCSDTEATAWQFAAAQEVGLPDELLFPDDAFDGQGPENLQRLKANSYFGINGLQAAGWTRVRANPRSTVPVYPKLAFWLHPAQLPEPIAA